eukprot:SAG11_NODE_190_length_12980_cov_11.633802_3_plen_130_part_00
MLRLGQKTKDVSSHFSVPIFCYAPRAGSPSCSSCTSRCILAASRAANHSASAAACCALRSDSASAAAVSSSVVGGGGGGTAAMRLSKSACIRSASRASWHDYYRPALNFQNVSRFCCCCFFMLRMETIY